MGPSPRPRAAGLALLAAVTLAALALAGCGRRGPLELPPGAPPTAQSTAAQQAADQAEPTAVAKNQIFREEPAPRPINAPPAAKPNGFFLDPLL